MLKKVCFYIFLFFCFIFNIVLDLNIRNYIKLLNTCFNKNITISNKLYALICAIIALISILISIDILLIIFKKQTENKGIKIKKEDGTHGTADWMQENEVEQVLGINNVSGIILGKYNGNLVKLPFDSHFNKNICVFRKFRKYENNRISSYKFIRTFNLQKINYSNRSKR